jgi:2-polyprenyl-3-methyl-5-hydroxy-6-metoxy-1,4-benzoquinol methylase
VVNRPFHNTGELVRLPYVITKETVQQARKDVQRISFMTSLYFKLRYRLLCLGVSLCIAVAVPRGYLALCFFFVTDYILFRAHRNFITKQQLDYLEHFLESQNLEKEYIEGLDHNVASERFSSERLTYNLIRKRKLDVFIEEHNFQTAKLLDVGCSGGWLTESYKHLPNYRQLFGVDLNLPGLRAYKKIHPDISPPILGNVESLPFKANSLDIIFATDIIEHLFRPDLFLEEVHAILRPGGTFYLSTNNAHYIPFAYFMNPFILLEKIVGLYFPVILPTRNLVYGDTPPDQYYHTDFERKDFLDLLAGAGLKIRKVGTFNFLWDVFAPFGQKMQNRLPARVYFLCGRILESVSFFKYTGEHWHIVAKK